MYLLHRQMLYFNCKRCFCNKFSRYFFALIHLEHHSHLPSVNFVNHQLKTENLKFFAGAKKLQYFLLHVSKTNEVLDWRSLRTILCANNRTFTPTVCNLIHFTGSFSCTKKGENVIWNSLKLSNWRKNAGIAFHVKNYWVIGVPSVF